MTRDEKSNVLVRSHPNKFHLSSISGVSSVENVDGFFEVILVLLLLRLKQLARSKLLLLFKL